MIAEGGIVYECFIRAKGPNQWFPLGPMAVKQGLDDRPGDVERGGRHEESRVQDVPRS